MWDRLGARYKLCIDSEIWRDKGKIYPGLSKEYWDVGMEGVRLIWMGTVGEFFLEQLQLVTIFGEVR